GLINATHVLVQNNCGKCSQTANECQICESDEYYLDAQNTCKPCSVIPHCIVCTSGTQCYECDDGYGVDTDGNCKLLTSGVLLDTTLKQRKNKKSQKKGCDSKSITVAGECVSIGNDEYKKSESVAKKCSKKFFGCYSCEYLPDDGTFNRQQLKCTRCQTGMAFESSEYMKCVTIESGEMVDDNNIKVKCMEGCSMCTTSTNCIYTDNSAHTARNEILNNYINHKFCQKYIEYIGCTECSNTIGSTGICNNNDRNNECSFMKENNGEYECMGYIEATKTTQNMKTADVNCLQTVSGRCVRCSEGNYLSKDSPPKCLSCIENCSNCTAANDCNLCKNGYVWNTNKCESVLNCVETNFKGCTKCVDSYYLKEGKCYKLTDSNCKSALITATQNIVCNLCINNYILDNGKCVEKSTKSCSVVDPKTSQCSECSAGYMIDKSKSCSNILTSLCSYSSQYECLKCTAQNRLGKVKGDSVCAASISNSFCLENTNTGCSKCNEGFYVHGKECRPCDTKCGKCSLAADNCLTCAFGYYYDDTTSDCLYVGELAEKCKTFLPSGVDCAACKDGYLLVNMDCVKCEEKCGSCVSTISNCVKCNVTGGYFEDIEMSTPDEKKCIINTTLEHCVVSSDFGCGTCEDKYYPNEYNKCTKCEDTCATCSNGKTCTTCVDQYVLISKTSQCTKWDAITNCKSYDTQTQKCAECSGSNKVGPNGDECVHKTNVLAIVLPIIFTIILIVVIIIAIGCVLFYIHYKKEEKLRNSLVNEFLVSDLKTKGTEFVYLGDHKDRILCSTKVLKFENEIPVQKDSEIKFFVGNDRASMLKFQFTTQNDEDKFEVSVTPDIAVGIKKNRAVEFTVIVHPLCTITKTVDITYQNSSQIASE
ncbi:tyrosine kinase, putative, partial [Entamoeba invadens IP1]